MSMQFNYLYESNTIVFALPNSETLLDVTDSIIRNITQITSHSSKTLSLQILSIGRIRGGSYDLQVDEDTFDEDDLVFYRNTIKQLQLMDIKVQLILPVCSLSLELFLQLTKGLNNIYLSSFSLDEFKLTMPGNRSKRDRLCQQLLGRAGNHYESSSAYNTINKINRNVCVDGTPFTINQQDLIDLNILQPTFFNPILTLSK